MPMDYCRDFQLFDIVVVLVTKIEVIGSACYQIQY